VYLRKADGNSARNGLGFIEYCVRSDIEDLVPTGLLPRGDAGSEEINLGGRSTFVLEYDLGQASVSFYDVYTAFNPVGALQSGN